MRRHVFQMKTGPGCRKFRGASFGRGARGPGGWGFGKKLENVACVVIVFDSVDLFPNDKTKLTKKTNKQTQKHIQHKNHDTCAWTPNKIKVTLGT